MVEQPQQVEQPQFRQVATLPVFEPVLIRLHGFEGVEAGGVEVVQVTAGDVGAALQFTQVRAQWRLVLLNSAWRLLCIPMLAWGMCQWFGLNAVATQVLVIFFGLPTASASYVLTKVLKGDATLMASIISLQTLLSLLTLPLLIVLTT